jgi:hypothetical protein
MVIYNEVAPTALRVNGLRKENSATPPILQNCPCENDFFE